MEDTQQKFELLENQECLDPNIEKLKKNELKVETQPPKSKQKYKTLAINSYHPVLNESPNEDEEMSPIPKKATTPKHNTHKRPKSPFTISPEIGSADVGPSRNSRSKQQVYTRENIFFRTPSPKNKSSFSSSRYSALKKDAPLQPQPKPMKRSNTEENLINNDIETEKINVFKKNMHRRELSDCSGCIIQQKDPKS